MPQYFNPNVIQKQATPEGHAGQNAHLYIPFGGIQGGYWFASGQQLTFLTGEIPQRTDRILMGQMKPNTFRKDASACLSAPTVL